MRVGQRLESIFVFSIDDDAISAIRVVRNPDKLKHLSVVLQGSREPKNNGSVS